MRGVSYLNLNIKILTYWGPRLRGQGGEQGSTSVISMYPFMSLGFQRRLLSFEGKKLNHRNFREITTFPTTRIFSRKRNFGYVSFVQSSVIFVENFRENDFTLKLHSRYSSPQASRTWRRWDRRRWAGWSPCQGRRPRSRPPGACPWC